MPGGTWADRVVRTRGDATASGPEDEGCLGCEDQATCRRAVRLAEAVCCGRKSVHGVWMTELRNKLGRWLLVLIWMGIIFWLSGQPDLPHHPESGADIILKKAGHMAEYAILAGLIWWACQERGGRLSGRVLVYALGLSGAYAISDEVHQLFVPGRSGQALDVALDILGAIVALLVISGFAGWRAAGQLR